MSLPAMKIGRATQETNVQPARRKTKAVFVGAGAAVALLLAGVTIKALLRRKRVGDDAPESGEVHNKKPARKVADEKRNELMREMGKKGAAKRWKKKQEAAAQPAAEPEGVDDDSAAVSA